MLLIRGKQQKYKPSISRNMTLSWGLIIIIIIKKYISIQRFFLGITVIHLNYIQFENFSRLKS